MKPALKFNFTNGVTVTLSAALAADKERSSAVKAQPAPATSAKAIF